MAMSQDQNFEFKFKSRVTEILPKTERIEQRLAKQRQQEKLRQQELEKAKIQKEREEKLKIQIQMEAQQKQAEIRKKQEEEERRKKEESALISTLQGKFGSMIQNLKENDTKLDYTISGLALKEAQVRILIKAIEKNTTLKGLAFTRKNISDHEGQGLVLSLKDNQSLERLEFEGNNFGPESCNAIAQVLKTNQTLRVIDLEGNNLTKNYSETKGIEQLAQALEQNETLLCINLSNTNLDARCSEVLMRMLERNTTLISMDIDMNPKMNLHHVRAIQQSLLRNKENYDKERYCEFLERKQMWRESNISSILQGNREAKKVLQENINTRIEAKRQQMEEDWNKKLENEETLRLKQIARLEKEAMLRKKGKKGRKKKKK